MQQSIEDRVGDRRLPDPAVPVLDRQLRGDHGGAPLGPIVDDLEQVLATVGLERLQRPVVELCGATHNSTYVQRTDMWSWLPSRPRHSPSEPDYYT